MTKLFWDTLYLLAIANSSDPRHQIAVQTYKRLNGRIKSFTTLGVLAEFLAGLSGKGPYYRKQATEVVERILGDPDITVLPLSHDLFRRGLDRYKQRPDKGYSLVDCISMVVMEDEGITDVLTNDHHFEQEGFTILIKRRD